jgi:hypothetical protein
MSRILIEASSASIKSSMLTLFFSSSLSDFVLGRRESLFAAVCLISEIWRTLKLNKRIYVSHRVTKALGKSVPERLS